MRLVWLAGLTLGTFIIVSPANAQVTRLLAPAQSVLNDEFTNVSAIRELTDSRVLLTDSREKRLVVGDWTSKSTRPIGRVGSGPGEFQTPSKLLAIGVDSTVLVDTQARRWMPMYRDAFAAPVPTADALRLTALEQPLLGVDRFGRLLLRQPIASRTAAMRLRAFDADSLFLVVGQYAGGAMDTIARLRGRGSKRGAVMRSTPQGMTGEYSLYSPLGIEEQALLLPDGWIAVAWLDPYRVQWFRPDGSAGPVFRLDAAAPRVTDAEKRFAIAREWAWLPPPAVTPAEFPAWPERLPAFTNDALFPLLDGRIAIRRMPSIARPHPLYDIVDRTGGLVGRLELPPRHRIIGFGHSYVYVVKRDEFDVERVSRHLLPVF